MYRLLIGILFSVVGFSSIAQAPQSHNVDETARASVLNVYLDCNYCDNGFFRQTVKDVNFVRDRKLADVHLLFISQRSGSGGSSERIQFSGLGEFQHLADILSFTIDVNMTADERRKTRLKYIELGLMRYRIEMGQADQIQLTIIQRENRIEKKEEDPWNAWVFGLNGYASFSGQETSNNKNFSASASAKRVTERNKFVVQGGFNQNIATYNYDGVKTVGRQQSTWSNARDVISLSDHWSCGFFGNAGNSLFSNYKLYAVGKTGVEYDFFKYSESFDKQAIVAYNLGARYNDYYDTTVFNRDEDKVAFHELTVGGSVKQNWGNLWSTVTYQNYLHDFSLNSLSWGLSLNVRLFKGFSWRVNGRFNLLHNQINIAKQNASIEDVLLQQQELGSGYSYWMNTGINYSFGSIYNTVVNPRFDI